jgi:hypothetical protein
MTYRSRLIAVGIAAATFACHAAPRQRPVKMGPVDTGAGTLTAARKYLEGRWVLESFEVYPPGQPPLVVKGSGVLTYDEFSNLRMEIRADPDSTDKLRQLGVDVGDGTITTDGRATVDLQNKTLTYAMGGQPPGTGPLAMTRPRHYQVDNGVLTLTTQDENGKPLSMGRWRKSS